MCKIRQGFVSNSSSSSFICDVSGGAEGGYDVSLSDVGMVECEKGHIFYDHYIVDPDKDVSEVNENYPYDLLSKYCPICTLGHIGDSDILKYIIKCHNMNKFDVLAEIKNTFSDYEALTDYLKK